MIPTYDEITEKVRQQGCSICDCWIAEVKRKYGLTTRRSWNTGQGIGKRPCPPNVFKTIENVLRAYRAI